MEEINNNDIPCISGSCPMIYMEKAFNNSNFRPSKRLSVAKN